MMGPLAMILVGLEMSDISLKELVSDPKVYFSSFIKLCISPVLAFALISILSYFLDFTQITVNIITAAAVPSANNLLMFSNKLGRSAKTPTKMVVISTILSILTIPIALNVFT
jgi:predicted permease